MVKRQLFPMLAALLCAGSVLTGCDVGTAGDDGAGPAARHRTPTADPSDQPTSPTSPPPGTRRPKGPVSSGWTVSRVIDGDTVEVSRGRRMLNIRLIGIDTPETVHPTEPVECYGPEASRYATRTLLGQPVLLEFDRSQGRRDYYGRTLAYVWRTHPAQRLFNLDAVRRGFALEYTYDTAYAWQRAFRQAGHRAQSAHLGVWRCPHPGS